MRPFSIAKFAILLFLLLFSLPATAMEEVPEFSPEIQEFDLENGMKFLIVERDTVPQVACRLAVRAGSALEDTGKKGIAHMLEHMMFKGTKNFGTTDIKKDRELQEKIEEAYHVVRRERNSRSPNRRLIKEKMEEMERLRSQVQELYVPHAFSSQLERNGAVRVNAFTTMDQTQYISSVPSDMIEQWFSIVSEQIFEPAWREFYVEKEVVQREWAFRYVNNPKGASWLDLNSTAYTAHPYRNPVIGWKSDMESYSTSDAKEFHRKYYNPSNTVCVLVGDLDIDRVKKLAGIYFGRYPSGERSPEEVRREPGQHGSRRSVRFLKGARTPIVKVGYHAARMGTRDFYALDAMTMLLSMGRGARMTRNIIEKGYAVDAWTANPDNRFGGMFILGGSPNEIPMIKKNGVPDQKEKRRAYLKACRDLEKLLVAEAEKLKTELVSGKELDRIKKLRFARYLRDMRSNEKLAGRLATLEVQFGWRYFKTYLEKMAQVTPENIREAARRYIRPENRTTVYVVPGGKVVTPPDAYREIRSSRGVHAVDTEKIDFSVNHSIYPTPDGWKHPLSFKRKPKKIDYPEAQQVSIEGARLFYLPDKELPLIDIAIFIKAGAVDVPEAMTGLSDLLTRCMVRGGTQKFSPHEMALFLDENAIQISVSIGEEMSVVRLSFLKEDLGKGLLILREVLTRPRFSNDIVKVAKTRIRSRLSRQGGNARAVLAREMKIGHFKGHPYGRDPMKALTVLEDINRGDLKKFVKEYFVPSNMVVTVSGDIAMNETVESLSALFETFPGKEAPARALNDPDKPVPMLALINKPGQVQAQVGMIIRGIQRTHADFWKLNLLTRILGGGDSLMFRMLRDRLGIVYVAGFYQDFKWNAGILKGYIGCRPDKTTEAIRETIGIMKGMGQNISEDLVELKRLDALNGFVFNVDTPAELVRTYGLYALRDEPLNTLETIQDVYMNVKDNDLIYLAKEYLDTERLQIFVVADKDITVDKDAGTGVTLEEDIIGLAEELGLPFREISLR